MNDWRDRADNKVTRKGARYYEGEPEVLPPKPDPGFDHAIRENRRHWESLERTPITRLKWCHSQLGKLDVNRDHLAGYEESVAEIRAQAATAIAMADPAQVLGEPRVRELVMTWWGEPGINRLRARVQA